MVEERGHIVRLVGHQVEIEFIRETACGTCKAKTTCGTGVLGAFFGRRQHRVLLDNSVDAAPGEWVVVGVDESDFVAASMMIYLVPLLTLFAGALVADVLWGRASGSGSEMPVVLGAVAGFVLGMMGLKRWAVTGSRSLRILRKEPNTGTEVRLT